MIYSIEIYLLIVSIALFIDTFIPDFSFVWKYVKHPVVILGSLISVLEKLLYNQSKFNGGLLWVIIISIWGCLGFIVESFLSQYDIWGMIINGIIVVITIASFALKHAVKKVMVNLDKNNITKARHFVSHLCSRDTTKMKADECGRSALESLSENFSDGVIAPVFYYCLFGLTGLFVYKAINTLDSMVGYKSDKYKNFGFISAKMDDVANYIPARLSMVFVVLGSLFNGKTNTASAINTVVKFAHTHKSPNAGYPESAFAGALKIAIGGKRHYAGIGTVEIWIGDGNKNVGSTDIYNGIKLFNSSIIITIITIVSIAMYLLATGF
ncbi:MAG: adenosylcobinamide-phosphate synthase CbiB [Alphaproteobacteria bacterium]